MMISNDFDRILQVLKFCGKIWGDWRSGQRHGLRTKGFLVRDLARSPFVVALNKSHLPPA